MEKKNEIVEINGKKVVLVNDMKYQSRKISWEDIEKALKEYVGKAYQINETGEIIFIGNDFPDEYAHSKDSFKSKRSIKRAKMNLITALDKLVFTSTNKTILPDFQNKHGSKAKNGWSRYDVYFGIPIFDNDKNTLGYNYYNGKMIVRHAKSKKSFLYDIVRIKKSKI